jgi:uncharacterized repeat protein (TIGR01451 family)
VTSTSICQGSSQTIDSDSATGIQWYKDTVAIPGAGSQSYIATLSGIYTAQLNALGCHSQFGRDVTLTVNPNPSTPTITPSGPTTFFFGGSVTLTSSSASGNQWYVNGNPIGGATNAQYVATVAGDYTVIVTSGSCSSAQSATTHVTVNPPQADLALTLSDHHNTVEIGRSVNYIVEVTNPGPSPVTATVTDTLPSGVVNGSWVCVPFGGAACASGFGNALSDTATLPVGSEAAYVYTATVVTGDASDLLTNTASVAVVGGTDPVMANNSASDSDVVKIFVDGFDGTPLMLPTGIGKGGDYVTATLRVDANLLNTLSLVPTAVATGRGADGKALFTLELARFGSDIVLRALTTDASGASRQSAWQSVSVDQHLLTFAWQTASNGGNDGYLQAGGTSTSLLLSGSTEHDRLTQLWVTVENSVPWLVLITN